MSDMVFELLRARCGTRTKGWLFPAKRGKTGHLTTLAERFQDARAKASGKVGLVLRPARLRQEDDEGDRKSEGRHESHGSQGCQDCDEVQAS